jgi:two-component system, sensor histidine kinase and response regulator
LQTQLEVDENLIGRSTRYFFTLPMERVHVERNEPVLSPEVRDLRIFLVANDPTPNRIIQHYSRHAGITLEGAPTGAEAILELARASQEAPYDILAVAPPIEDLTSLQMAKAVRGSDLAYLKLLYVAPWDDPQDRLNHIQGGFDDTICKQLRKKEMFDSFHRLAGRIPKKQQGKTPLILIVEDNGINAQIASFQLRTLGYDSEIVTNGELAVEAWTRGTFDAILMDLQMPVLDGFAATRMIREREQNRSPSGRIPIIAFTANDDWKAQAMAAGCDDFLIKPVVKNVLKATMDRWLKASVR